MDTLKKQWNNAEWDIWDLTFMKIGVPTEIWMMMGPARMQMLTMLPNSRTEMCDIGI